jgi:hypothetical protein
MKEWMITYAFLLGFLSLALCGTGTPAKTNSLHSSSKHISKKIFSFAGESKNGDREDYSALHHHTKLPCSITPYFTLGENTIQVSRDYSITQTVIAAEPERVLKDHLLHLFPSHYFW